MPAVLAALVVERWHLLATVLAVAGVAALLLARALPTGLGGALFVFGLSAAAAVAVFERRSDRLPLVQLALYLAAGLCLAWTMVAVVASLRRSNRRQPIPSFAASALSGSLVLGVLAAVLVAYALTFSVMGRLFSPPDMLRGMTADDLRRIDYGALAILAVLAAVLLWRLIRREPHQPAMILLLSIMLLTWFSLRIPVPALASAGLVPHPPSAGPLREWWSWIAALHAAHAAIVFGAFVLYDRVLRRRRDEGWPDRLELVIAPPPAWDGYIEAVAVIAAATLLLGTIQLVRGGAPGRLIALANFASAITAGAGCFLLCHRIWNANLFGLGASLITLAMADFAVFVILPPMTWSSGVRMPILYTAVLAALVFAAFLWFWLSRFWRQQLLDDQPWTIAGRAIPYARHTGFLVAALAVLIAYQIALWPLSPNVVAPDNSPARWVSGILVMLLLAVVTAGDARRRPSVAVAGLSLAAIGAAVVFAYARWPNPVQRGQLLQYLPMFTAMVALPLLAAAERISPEGKWRSFAHPLWFLALLVLPAGALLTLLSAQRLPAEWVMPTTLALVGVVYAIAGTREGRRAFLALSAVLLLAAAFNLMRLYRASVVQV